MSPKTAIIVILSSIMLFGITVEAVAQNDDCHYKLSGSDRADFDKGVEAYNNKRYQQCSTLMRKVSSKHRTAADPYFYLGVASVKAGERPAVIKNHFARLFKLCPDYPNALAYYYMGVVHYTYKEYAEAVTQLQHYFDIANQQPNPAYDAVYEEASTYLSWSEFLAEAQQNEAPFFPVVVTGVSTSADEYLPYMTHDKKELYYLRRVAMESHNSFYSREDDDKVLRLYGSRWKDTSYTRGEMLPTPFNESGEEGCVTLTADNRMLYYSVTTREKGYNNCDIWYSERKKGVWQPLQNAGRNVNGERTWESQPSISADGQYLYFASNRPGGQGGTDIWVCRRLANGDWSRAENMGPSINTPGNEKSPFIHADGKTLYFASDGWQGFGGYDMYFIDITDTYRKYPTNLGLPINTEDDDICFGVTADGKQGYFAGKSTEWRGVGGSDVFVFELYPSAQPEEMAIVEGTLRDATGRAMAGAIEVLRQKSGADRYNADTIDGHYALALAAKGVNTVIYNAEGYLPRVAIGNAAQLRRDIRATDFVMLPMKLWGRYPMPLPKNGKNLLPLSRNATMVLDAYTDFMLEHPKVRVRIEATTMEEAKAIYDYLLSRQLRAERLEYKPNQSLSAPVLVITQM